MAKGIKPLGDSHKLSVTVAAGFVHVVSPKSLCHPLTHGSRAVRGQQDGARGRLRLCPCTPGAEGLGSCNEITTLDGLLATEKQSL